MTRKTFATQIRHMALLAVLLATGCAEPTAPLHPPQRSWKPIGEQLIDLDSHLRETPFRVLLSFESDSNLAFLAGDDRATRDESILHSGPASLAIPAGSRGFAVKLSSLLPATSFPGSWTLVGAYFYANEPTVLALSYEVAGKSLAQRSIPLARRQWTPAFLDLTPLSDPNSPPPPPPGLLRISLQAGSPKVWCDDVMVVDNTQTVVSGNLAADGWTVRVRGFKTILEHAGQFAVSIDTTEGAADAWQLVQANEMRARFTGAGGKRDWTIYSDGRAYVDGKFSPVTEFPAAIKAAFGEQHESPAELTVPEELGRLDRNTPGDSNNDGYAELSGTYQIKANGPRLVIKVRPTTQKLIRPIFEISGFPDGHVTGNLEGTLVEKTSRLPDQHVLVELPGTIEREVTLELKVQ